MKRILISTISIILILISGIVLANNNIALNYNIIPEIPNGYVVDRNHNQYINFSLFENENTLYFKGQKLDIINNAFSINIEELEGKNEFTISNDLGETVTYTYYISDENGYLKDFKLDGLKNNSTKCYIKTVNNVSIIYTEKEKETVKSVEEIILSLPEKLLNNLEEIKLIPTEHISKAAGITNYDKIVFYNLSKYSKATIKNIVIHEIAHTWAFELMKDKKIDFSYTDYREKVESDNKFPSQYAKENVKNGKYNEDFAESVSFFLINESSFTNKYPARASYIKELLEK